jgi:hypothetical protein
MRMPSRTTNRSTTASMVCRLFLVSRIRSGAIQLHNLTVNPRTHESFAPDLFDYVTKLSRLIPNEWRQQNDF